MATMKDVARLAKVSTSTVSHVINNDRYVSPQIKELVEEAIKQLNYAPSALARSLKLKETRTIGMVVTTSNNPFFSEVLQGVELSCYELGYNLILCNTEGSKKRLQNNIETLLSKSVDGILVMCTETDTLTPEIFSRYPSLPIVMMDWAPFNGVCDVIRDNSLLGATLATQHLIENGYKSIACITGPQNNPQAQLHLEGYRIAMKQAKLKIHAGYEAEGDFLFQSGYEAMTQLLALKNSPEAVFCCNDAMAIGAYQALYQAGLEAGKDIAMIGYDDIELAQYMTPPLTTIHQPKSELGQLAVETLLHRLKHKDEEAEVLTLTPVLQKRRSVNPKAPA